MTTYGTIPTSTTPTPANFEYISRAKARLQEGLGTRRPWREMFDHHCFSLPSSTSDATSRIKANLSYFQMNYCIIFLLIIFLSLLWNPVSLIVFLVAMVAWVFLYFLRDVPLVVFNRTISDRTVMVVLGVLTVVVLLFTHVTGEILGALVVAVVVVLVHAGLRKMEYLELDEEAQGFLKSAAAARGATSSSSG